MKYLFASDIHINESRFLNDTKRALNFVHETVLSERPDYLILLGDIFDKRRPVPTEMRVLNQWLTHVKEAVKQVIILEGNHDLDIDVSTLSYIQDLGIEKVAVVHPPFVFNGFYLGHEHIEGAVADNNFVISGGASLEDIIRTHDECAVFAFGDFHKPQILQDVPFCFYAGSLTKTNFSERDDDKKLWLFNNHKLEKTISVPTRAMFQFDINVADRVDVDEPAPWEGLDLADALVKIVYSGTKEALSQVHEKGLKKDFLEVKKVHRLKVEYKVTDRSKPRNENMTESISDEQALKEYVKDRNMKRKKEVIQKGLDIINE